MKEAGLQGRQARRYRVRTTDSANEDPIAPNLLAEVPAPTKADEVWGTDITYVETGRVGYTWPGCSTLIAAA